MDPHRKILLGVVPSILKLLYVVNSFFFFLILLTRMGLGMYVYGFGQACSISNGFGATKLGPFLEVRQFPRTFDLGGHIKTLVNQRLTW